MDSIFYREGMGRARASSRIVPVTVAIQNVDKDAEAAWATEVNRRVAELDSGAVKTIPWAEARRRLAAR